MCLICLIWTEILELLREINGTSSLQTCLPTVSLHSMKIPERRKRPLLVFAASEHPWFKKDLNIPKTRAIRSTIWDDRFFWGSAQFTNDPDAEAPHKPVFKDKVTKRSNHRGDKELFFVLKESLEKRLLLYGALGMRFGPNFDLCFGRELQQRTDSNNPNRLWKLFRPTLRIPMEGMCKTAHAGNESVCFNILVQT